LASKSADLFVTREFRNLSQREATLVRDIHRDHDSCMANPVRPNRTFAARFFRPQSDHFVYPRLAQPQPSLRSMHLVKVDEHRAPARIVNLQPSFDCSGCFGTEIRPYVRVRSALPNPKFSKLCKVISAVESSDHPAVQRSIKKEAQNGTIAQYRF
jgi:hypothetical protein